MTVLAKMNLSIALTVAPCLRGKQEAKGSKDDPTQDKAGRKASAIPPTAGTATHRMHCLGQQCARSQTCGLCLQDAASCALCDWRFECKPT